MKRLNFRTARTFVTALTLFATSLTATVCSADESPAPATTAATSAIAPTAPAAPSAAAAPIATAPSATPLQLREPHPLALAQDPIDKYAAWKLVAALAMIAAGAYAFKKHSDKRRPVETIRSLQVLKKLSIGVRTELIVVDVDGQRLLLGVTPSSIQTLASLPDPEPSEQEEIEQPEQTQTSPRFAPTYRPGEIGERSQQLGERLAALVQRSRVAESEKPAELRPDLRVTARPQRRATTKKPSAAPGADALEGQARGLGKIGRL
ncbi:MAG: flagellar biosynthetic protein FliO [Polyangiaceae bacterium]